MLLSEQLNIYIVEYLYKQKRDAPFVLRGVPDRKLCRRIWPFGKKNPPTQLSTLDQFEKLRLKIYEDPAHCVQYYASESGFSVRRFEHYYKQFFQISPKDDLTKARLLSAQDKLSSGLPYEEIAESLGFGSSEYFYKWYRAHLGASPKTVAHKK